MPIVHEESDDDRAASDARSSGSRAELSEALLQVVRRRIRTGREQLGLTQAEAAEMAGLRQSDWSRLERGPAVPRLTQLLQIQAALGVPSLEWFLGDLPSLEYAKQFAGAG